MQKEKTKRPTIGLKLGIVIPMVILVLFVLVAVFAESIAPHNPREINLANSILPPFWQGGTIEYSLGTDLMGRDILSRIIYGARVSLFVSLVSNFLSGSIGIALGIIAGYMGGWVDTLVSRPVDLMLGFPTILVALVLAVLLGPSTFNVILVIALLLWATYARQARGETLKIREMDYVTLARVAGCSNLTIILRHILPNVLNSIIVLATLQVGYVIIMEASLSFLGCGVPPPEPSWGNMVAGGRDIIVSAWWVSFFPGFATMLVVLAGNVFGDWLRDRLDPRLRQL
jgi:peptide/nickel transport system permease protein